MAYSTGPYRLFPNLPSPGASTLTSSRKIDFSTGKYVTDDDGGFEAQDDIAQRVMLKICYLVPEQKFLTPQANATTEAEIRAALADMYSGPEPEIELLSVSKRRDAAGRTSTVVAFRILSTGNKTTVEIP
jgi:hypothetical protein